MVSVQVSTEPHAPAEIIGDIENDIIESADRGLVLAAGLVPGMLKETFLAFGARGDNSRWSNIGLISLPLRRENPNLFEPLLDTGALQDSGTVHRVDEGIFEITLLEYGAGQDDGTTIHPITQRPVLARPHMFIVEGEDTDLLDTSFERGFNSE